MPLLSGFQWEEGIVSDVKHCSKLAHHEVDSQIYRVRAFVKGTGMFYVLLGLNKNEVQPKDMA